MAKIKGIRQDGSLPFVFDRGGKDITGYICTIFVKQFPEDTATITRVIAPEGDAWPGFLTQTETSTLKIGLWIINARLVKSDTQQEEAIPVRFTINKKWD